MDCVVELRALSMRNSVIGAIWLAISPTVYVAFRYPKQATIQLVSSRHKNGTCRSGNSGDENV